MKLPQDRKLNNLGQSMLEITIALGIGLLVLSALTFMVLIGLKNSQYAENQIQATKLAQEGIEFIKYMRDRDNPIQSGTNCYWDTSIIRSCYVWSNAWDLNITYYLLTQAADGSPQMTDVSTPAELSLNNGKFARRVHITTITADQEIQFRVTVKWSDSSGSHKSELVTFLANY